MQNREKRAEGKNVENQQKFHLFPNFSHFILGEREITSLMGGGILDPYNHPPPLSNSIWSLNMPLVKTLIIEKGVHCLWHRSDGWGGGGVRYLWTQGNNTKLHKLKKTWMDDFPNLWQDQIYFISYLLTDNHRKNSLRCIFGQLCSHHNNGISHLIRQE